MGLIPAGAGTTPPRWASALAKWAHPRRCGDHRLADASETFATGSSPQVRGPLSIRGIAWSWRRLIPAGAGTTRLLARLRIAGSAHPRRCGDHNMTRFVTFSAGGSSPQVRGPPFFSPCRVCLIGLIPAGAGTTRLKSLKATLNRAHPRRCGDHALQGISNDPTYGSSPQVRGPRLAIRSYLSSLGLIPAGAGTTTRPLSAGGRDGAHPRRCGDHVIGGSPSGSQYGSSPQVRGPRDRKP